MTTVETTTNAKHVDVNQPKSDPFPAGINRYMDIIKMYDESITQVKFVLDGDTVKKSAFSFTIAVKDVLKITQKSIETIFNEIKTFNESQDSNYDITRLAMSETIRKGIRPRNYTILIVEMEESEYYNYKDAKMITYHKFDSYNVRKERTIYN